MIKLGVNIDHVATIRQARGISEPDPVAAAVLAEMGGADGITVHLREDRRHIQDRDVMLLRQVIKTKLNLEMALAPEIIAIAEEIKPDTVTLVPEKRQELTTEGGLDVIGQQVAVTEVVRRFQSQGIIVSLFIDPDADQIAAAHKTGAEYIEIHTGRYCDAHSAAEQQHEYKLIEEACVIARNLNLGVNAGHGLNYRNIQPIVRIPGIEEMNIGHSIIGYAVLVGLERAVREMKNLLMP
ncbi:MAG: pyridoxine 5'-phosphate synthase [Deltaproteobacteria bacterium]|nr:pyridoxine 5'-phosphate synthase [Candidatus Anaeroferrophillus wilburensis]MBN2888275.1 pyridoxine 5'-phosphate synthase [Deltaproteobacteria bacterium]